MRHPNSQKRSLSKIFPRRVRKSGSRLEKIGRDTVAPGDRIQPGSGGLDFVTVGLIDSEEELAYHATATRHIPLTCSHGLE